VVLAPTVILFRFLLELIAARVDFSLRSTFVFTWTPIDMLLSLHHLVDAGLATTILKLSMPEFCYRVLFFLAFSLG
jgi:hypothetical protein